jgi:homoserine dehydrogenase
VNGTTNFILSEMEDGASYDEALAEAQRRGFAEADPTEDVSGADAAAKMAILATVAFGSRVTFDDVEYDGIEQVTSLHVAAAREMGMAVRLIGAATLVGERFDVRVYPALVDRHHPLAAVEGAFNAVMLQGDAIREITLEGPGAGGIETASAVVGDIVSVIGTSGTGFLQNDACWRSLDRLPPGELRSPYYVHVDVDDRPGVLAHLAERLAAHEVSVARLVQHQRDGHAVLHVVTHEAPPAVSRPLFGSRGAAGGPGRALGASRDLGPRRLRPRLGVTLRIRVAWRLCRTCASVFSPCVTHPREVRRYARKRVVVRGGPSGSRENARRVSRAL